jgi:quinol monooxygenase YgiN
VQLRPSCDTMPAMTYGLFGSFLATPGQRDELVGHLLRAADLMRADDACLLYVVATTDRPDEVAVLEVWQHEAAHDASLQREGVPELIAQARPVIAGVAGQTRLTVHGGKGV